MRPKSSAAFRTCGVTWMRLRSIPPPRKSPPISPHPGRAAPFTPHHIRFSESIDRSPTQPPRHSTHNPTTTANHTTAATQIGGRYGNHRSAHPKQARPSAKTRATTENGRGQLEAARIRHRDLSADHCRFLRTTCRWPERGPRTDSAQGARGFDNQSPRCSRQGLGGLGGT